MCHTVRGPRSQGALPAAGHGLDLVWPWLLSCSYESTAPERPGSQCTAIAIAIAITIAIAIAVAVAVVVSILC